MGIVTFMSAGSGRVEKAWLTHDEPDCEVWLRLAKDLFVRGEVGLERFEEMAWMVLHDEVPEEFVDGLPAPLGLRSTSRAFDDDALFPAMSIETVLR